MSQSSLKKRKTARVDNAQNSDITEGGWVPVSGSLVSVRICLPGMEEPGRLVSKSKGESSSFCTDICSLSQQQPMCIFPMCGGHYPLMHESYTLIYMGLNITYLNSQPSTDNPSPPLYTWTFHTFYILPTP